MFDEAINYIFTIKSFRAGTLLLFIEKYVNAGIKQYERMSKHREDIKKTKVPREFKEPLATLFYDIHFYFICWDKVHNLFLRFCEVVGDAKLEKIKTRYASDFQKYSEARNNLEHIDERLLGKTRGKKPKFPGDLGNLAGDYYTFWGEKYYVGNKSIETLKDFHRNLLGWLEKATGGR